MLPELVVIDLGVGEHKGHHLLDVLAEPVARLPADGPHGLRDKGF